ncbi:MAG: hypothetical protein AABZ64_09305 [Nitrospinota bacterium]
MSEGIPPDLEGLRYFDDPAIRRMVAKTAIRTKALTIGQFVDMVFDDCYSEQDFDERAQKWIEAINGVVDPPWGVNELKDWAMNRRGLRRQGPRFSS